MASSKTKKFTKKVEKDIVDFKKRPKIIKKIEPISEPKELISVFNQFKRCYQIIKFQKDFFIYSVVTYIFLSVLLVINISSFTSISSVKSSYIHGISTLGANLKASFSTFGSVSGILGSSNSASSSVIQYLLFLIFGLVFIKGIREANRSHKLKFSDGIYNSTSSFIQFLLVTILLVAEVIPVIISLYLAQTVLQNGIATGFGEKLIWVIISGLIFAGGWFLVVSSIFAIFIATLPDMKPWASVKSSWKLVKKRRLLISRKILGALLSLFLIFGIIGFLLIFMLPVISAWVLLVIGMVIMLVIYTYLYSLYKELI